LILQRQNPLFDRRRQGLRETALRQTNEERQILIKTNKQHLVETAGVVEVHPMHTRDMSPYKVGRDGDAFCLPGPGGIVYNVRVGDTAYGWMADHFEPGVTARNPDDGQNFAVQNLVCVGNDARVVSGDAKGELGVVIGTHAGSEHVMIDFAAETMEKLVYGDKIMIRMVGKGLVFEDYPSIRTLRSSPKLIEAIALQEGPDGMLMVPVVAKVPPQFMGSGIGWSSERGDYDLMTGDKAALARHGLDQLRLGDFVAILDHDNRYGRGYRRGAITVGVIVHGDCLQTGHGPGIVPLFTTLEPVIEPVIEPDANLASVFDLREDWR
jgi:hypothetical protein